MAGYSRSISQHAAAQPRQPTQLLSGLDIQETFLRAVPWLSAGIEAFEPVLPAIAMVSAAVSQQGVDAIGYLGGALLAGCFLPQIYQLIATRSVHDISITWSLLYNGGLILTTVYLFKDAPGAWLPSIFELAGGLLVLGLKLFFEHTAVGRRMTAARLQQQQAQAQQEQQALEEQEQEQWKLQQQGKHMAGSETLDLRLNLVFSDDSAAGLGSSVLELQEEAYGSSSTDGGRELILAGASAEPGAAGPSPRQRGARKPPGLLLRLPTQRLGVDIRTAYPLSPLPCQSVTGLKHQSSAARHSSAPGSMRERGAAAHAASNGQAPHLADSSRLQGGSATHSPNTPRAATVAGGVNWGSVSEGGTSCSALCPTPRGAARPVSGGKDPA